MSNESEVKTNEQDVDTFLKECAEYARDLFAKNESSFMKDPKKAVLSLLLCAATIAANKNVHGEVFIPRDLFIELATSQHEECYAMRTKLESTMKKKAN